MNTPLTTAEIVERVKPSAQIDETVGMAVRALRNEGLAMLAGSLNEWLVDNNARKSEAAAALLALEGALRDLVEAKALADVRGIVAGWNGEGREDGPYETRHPARLGAQLPKTTCGAIYELDEAMQRARAALSEKTV